MYKYETVEAESINDLSLDDMIGRYYAKEGIDSVKLKHNFKNRFDNII